MANVNAWFAKGVAWVSATLLTSTGRKRLYAATIALFSLLGILGLISAQEQAEWTAMLEKVLGTLTAVVALLHLSPDEVVYEAPEGVTDADASDDESASAAE